MGLCFSAKLKAHSPYHTEPVPKYEGTNVSETDIISSNNVASSHSELPFSSTEGALLLISNLRSFPFPDLKVATRNFRPKNFLGEGGFGKVYKGWVNAHTLEPSKPGNGMVIAVKRLKLKYYHDEEWLSQINYLGQLHHPNLVKLIGYCLKDEQKILVHEFMARGSLENHLFTRGSYFQPLSWKLRLKVALGAAKGLAFLHSSEACILFCDFKTSSILLDLNYNAKLSDFGLAKDEPVDEKSLICLRIVGTHEYAAPEYIEKGIFSRKTNVYSFGVVLLEILSGRRAADSNNPWNETNFVEWVKPYLASQRKVTSIMDNRLEGQYTIHEACNAAKLALRCLSTEAKLRPTMDQVAKFLEKLHDPNEPQSPKPN